MWRSSITKYRKNKARNYKHISHREKYDDDWKMYAIEHPNIDTTRFTTIPKFDAKKAKEQLNPLHHPFRLFSPVRAATECGRNFYNQRVENLT